MMFNLCRDFLKVREKSPKGGSMCRGLWVGAEANVYGDSVALGLEVALALGGG